MSGPREPTHAAERKMANVIGTLLRVGVLLAAAIVASGAVVYLARNGSSAPQYAAFRGEPSDLCSVGGIVHDAAGLSGRGIIQLGLLLLIATPVARVAVACIAFVGERDWMYVGVSLLVLCLLLCSLIIGPATQ